MTATYEDYKNAALKLLKHLDGFVDVMSDYVKSTDDGLVTSKADELVKVLSDALDKITELAIIGGLREASKRLEKKEGSE